MYACTCTLQRTSWQKYLIKKTKSKFEFCQFKLKYITDKLAIN